MSWSGFQWSSLMEEKDKGLIHLSDYLTGVFSATEAWHWKHLPSSSHYYWLTSKCQHLSNWTPALTSPPTNLSTTLQLTPEAPWQSLRFSSYPTYSLFSDHCCFSRDDCFSIMGFTCPLKNAVYICSSFHFFLYFLLFRAAPVAYGSSQARGWIRATSIGLHHSHSHMGSPTQQARPGIKPTFFGILVWFINCCAMKGTST